MKIMEAIDRLDALKYNTYTHSDKIQWLSQLDGLVKTHILDNHTPGGGDFTGYDDTTDPDTELLVPAPHDEMYLRWMEAQIDYHNGEYGPYNNAMLLFNTAFDTYAAFYTGHHLPVLHGKRFRF